MGFSFTTNGDIVTPDQLNEDLKKYLKYQKQKFIDKACKWLTQHINDYINEYNLHRKDIDCLFEEFRKVMEK